jgi:AcrR family transcriptional regulator
MSIKEKPLDPRVKRTRRLLREALVKLIPQKGYNTITVGDITEQATLNRATFYLHYRDKNDLLTQSTKEVWQELTSRHPLPVSQNGLVSVDATYITIKEDFEHLAEYEDFYRVMLGQGGVLDFSRQMQEFVYETTEVRLLNVLGALPDGPVPIEIVLRYIAAAYVGVMAWWLEQDRPYSADEMASLLVKLYDISLFEAMGLETASYRGESGRRN